MEDYKNLEPTLESDALVGQLIFGLSDECSGEIAYGESGNSYCTDCCADTATTPHEREFDNYTRNAQVALQIRTWLIEKEYTVRQQLGIGAYQYIHVKKDNEEAEEEITKEPNAEALAWCRIGLRIASRMSQAATA